MTEIQAALGVSQMNRLDEFVSRRHELKERYDDFLKNLPVAIPYQSANAYSAMHLYPLQLQLEILNKTHVQIFQELRDKGLGVNLHYIPIHTQPYYERMGFKSGDYPNAEHYYQHAISIPMYQGLTDAQQDQVVSIISKVLQ